MSKIAIFIWQVAWCFPALVLLFVAAAMMWVGTLGGKQQFDL